MILTTKAVVVELRGDNRSKRHEICEFAGFGNWLTMKEREETK